MGLFNLIFRKKVNALKGIPGPKPHFPLGSSLTLLGPMLGGGKQAWEVCADLGEKYGPVTQLWLGPSPALVLNDPKLVGDVLIENMDNFYKKSPTKALIPLTTDKSPFVLNGPAWAREREGDPFSQDWFTGWLETRFDLMRDYMIQRVDGMVGQKDMDLWDWSSRLTFDIFSMALVGKELGDDTYKAFMHMGDVGASRISSILPIPSSPLNPFFYISRKKWRNVFESLVQQTRKNPDPKGTDLINVVLRRQPQISPENLALIVGNVYFGGAYSAASAIATNLYLMASNPTQAQATQQQLRGRMDSRFTAADLAGADQLEYSLMESLRLLSPVPLYTRNSVKDKSVTFAGHQIPPNTLIFISNWVLHRSGSHWADPTTFKPERWADGGLEENPIGSGYFFPFGRGPRMCMGKPFALFTVRLALAVFHGRLQVKVQGDYKQDFYFGVMIPKKVTIGFTSIT